MNKSAPPFRINVVGKKYAQQVYARIERYIYVYLILLYILGIFS